jgi:hypothetical protein
MKTVRNAACLVGVCAIAVGLSSQTWAQAPAAAGPPVPGASGKKPPPPPAEAARVLDLSSSTIPIVIEEAGYYRLDRDWRPDHQGAQGPFLLIRADNVTLDLRGYSISVRNEGAAITIAGSSVTLRNGGVSGGDDQGGPLSVQGHSATIENLHVGGLNASYFGGETSSGLILRDSTFATGVYDVPPGSTITRNRFLCGFQSGLAIGDDTQVLDNVWAECDATQLSVAGAGNLVERNVFGPSSRTTVLVDGRSNLLRDNTLQVDGSTEPVLQVNNGANVLEANVVLPIPGGERATVGIRFTADGNSFGNNRLGALVPVDVGATTQTNWGGNVSF